MNLSTRYMGLTLRSPLVVSASPLSEKLDNILRMEDAGAGAVVLFSLFEEQIRQEDTFFESVRQSTGNSFPEALDYFPDLDDYHVGTAQYLELIRQAKERVDIPIFASLNGTTDEGWITYSRQMEQAGADGIEMNIFFIPGDLNMSGREVEQRYIDIVKHLKASVHIPIAVKLNPYFSAMGHMARELEGAGADSLVLFNRFYQPDFDIQNLRILHNLEYSESNEMRLPLLWTAMLSGKLNCSLAATTGVQSAQEMIKYLLAGADVVMTASALYKHGIGHIGVMLQDLREWMTRMQWQSPDQFRGVLSQRQVQDPTAFQRANYIRIVGAN